MKKKIIFFILSGLVLSCSKDEKEEVVAVNPEGTYVLTAFNTSVPTDLNGDGKKSIDQMTETVCFKDLFLTLKANNTYELNDKGVGIENDGVNETIACYNDGDTFGKWSLDGNNRVVMTPFDGQDEVPFSLLVEGNTLKETVADGDVVGTTTAGDPVYLASKIELVYTKK